VVFKKLLRWPVEEENNKYQNFACFYKKILTNLKLVPKAASEFFSGLPYPFYSNRRVSECSNKLFEKGYWKDF
jgi:hypothetical protein